MVSIPYIDPMERIQQPALKNLSGLKKLVVQRSQTICEKQSQAPLFLEGIADS